MTSQPRKARPRHRRAGESYEEKCERRHETRESLRRRHNVTACRCLGRGVEEPAQSPRQREFLRRRNLVSDAGRTAQGQEPEGRVPPDLSTQVEPKPPVLLQVTPAPGPEHSSVLCLLQLPPTTASTAHPLIATASKSKHSQKLGMHQQKSAFPYELQTEALTLCWGPHQLQGSPLTLSPSLQEALHRELLLKQKMVILQELFSTLLQASEKSWQGQLNEDKLKCKLRALENQLQACTQSYSKECVKNILIEMEDQKQTYEQKAKEALQKMLEDKLQTEQQLQNSQRSLAAMREDLAFWKEHYSTLKAELTQTTTAHTELENSFHVLQSKLQRATEQNQELGQALCSLQSEHAVLRQRASALRVDNDLKAEHISTIQDKLQKEQNQKVTLEATISHLQSLMQNQTKAGKTQEAVMQRKDHVFTTQTPPLTPAKEKQNTLLEHPEEEEGEESLEDEMQKRTSQLTAKENE
ncbi:T3JAM protein, partial [Podargus strigoides]|nr:T3JAM protein [Podargus strigoides]